MKIFLSIHQLSTRFDDIILNWGGALLCAILRCYVAWQFLKSGMVKIHDWPATLDLFHNEYHVPVLPPDLAAFMGAGGELFFPCLIILGLFTRPAALGLLAVNAMAVISYPQLWEFECPAAINDHFYWTLLLLVVVVFGAGRFSLDAIFNNKVTEGSV